MGVLLPGNHYFLLPINKPRMKPMPRLINICVQFQLDIPIDPTSRLIPFIQGMPPNSKKATIITRSAIKKKAILLVVILFVVMIYPLFLLNNRNYVHSIEIGL
jgi:hypothetical protein